MVQEIGLLFTEMPVLALIFLLVGAILIFVEELMPGFGVFGITGIISTIVGIVLRVTMGPVNYYVLQIILLVILQGIWALIGFLIVVGLSRMGWINRSWMIQKDQIVDGHSPATADYNYLIGQIGVVVSDLRPIGKAQFGDKQYDVNAGNTVISAGDKVTVTSVEGVRISVIKAKEDN